jgi:hypothetical protein
VASRSTDQSWSNATWQGSRGVQLRAALKMSVRQRLQALEELCELAQRLKDMPRTTARPAKKRPAAR